MKIKSEDNKRFIKEKTIVFYLEVGNQVTNILRSKYSFLLCSKVLSTALIKQGYREKIKVRIVLVFSIIIITKKNI
jgi:hypothetical protein